MPLLFPDAEQKQRNKKLNQSCPPGHANRQGMQGEQGLPTCFTAAFSSHSVFGAVLLACSPAKTEIAKDSEPVCPPAENIALCFFAATNPQGDHSPEPVRDAIKDALTLPLEELRAKRYGDYRMAPDQWTFEEVIGHTFTGNVRSKNGDLLRPDSEGFLEAVKQPEARPVLEKLLIDAEELVRVYKELNGI